MYKNSNTRNLKVAATGGPGSREALSLALILGVLLFLYSPVRGQDNIFISEFELKEVLPEEAQPVRAELINWLLKDGKYGLISGEQAQAKLEEGNYPQELPLTKEKVMEMSRLLDSGWALFNTLQKVNNVYVFFIRLLNVQAGRVERWDKVKGTDLPEVLANMPQALEGLLAIKEESPAPAQFIDTKKRLKIAPAPASPKKEEEIVKIVPVRKRAEKEPAPVSKKPGLLFLPFRFIAKKGEIWIYGNYEAEYGASNDTEWYPWNMWTPEHKFWLSMKGNPFKDMEFYYKFKAFSSRQGIKNFELDEAKLKYHFSKLDFQYLWRFDQHWLDSPLLNLVDNNRAADRDGHGDWQSLTEAVRLDLFDFYRFSGALIISKQKRHETDAYLTDYLFSDYINYQGVDYYVNFYGSAIPVPLLADVVMTKLKYNFFYNKTNGNTLDLSATYLRKGWKRYVDVSSFPGSNEIYGLDTKLTVFDMSLYAEYAKSTDVDQRYTFYNFGPNKGYFEAFKPGGKITEYYYDKDGFRVAREVILSDNDCSAWKAEVRDIRLTKYFRLQGAVYNYGKYFHDKLSRRFSGDDDLPGKEFDRQDGRYLEGRFFVPGKAIDITFKRDEFSTAYDKDKNDYRTFFSSRYRENWNYLEAYIRFKRDLNLKSSYELKYDRFGEWKNILLELTGENPTGFIKFQTKLLDIGTRTSASGLGERFGFGLESKINILDSLQFYARHTVFSGKTPFWGSGFYQLKYFLGYDMELYFEFGEGWVTDDNLVNDKDISENSTRKTSSSYKILFKVNF